MSKINNIHIILYNVYILVNNFSFMKKSIIFFAIAIILSLNTSYADDETTSTCKDIEKSINEYRAEYTKSQLTYFWIEDEKLKQAYKTNIESYEKLLLNSLYFYVPCIEEEWVAYRVTFLEQFLEKWDTDYAIQNYIYLKNWTTSRRELRSMNYVNNVLAYLYVKKAGESLAESRPESAISYLELILDDFPSDTNVMAIIASLNDKSWDYEEAKTYYNKILIITKDDEIKKIANDYLALYDEKANEETNIDIVEETELNGSENNLEQLDIAENPDEKIVLSSISSTEKEKIRDNTLEAFKILKKHFLKYDEDSRKIIMQSISNELKILEWKYSEEKNYMIEYLLILIDAEIK